MRWIPAYVAIGSNLQFPQRQVERAFTALAWLPQTQLLARSKLYVTRPLGPQDQPEFINAAAGLLTQLTAEDLLEQLKSIERSMGRGAPAVRWGPRIIDLDLLLHGAQVIDSPQLVLPHPGIHERNFVLYPLADIAATVLVPGRGTVEALARQVGADGLRPLPDPPLGSVGRQARP